MLSEYNAWSEMFPIGCLSSWTHARIFSWPTTVPFSYQIKTSIFFGKKKKKQLHNLSQPHRKQFTQQKREENKGNEPALTSVNTTVGFTTSLTREVLVEAERKGPHFGCFGVSNITLFSAPCSSGKSNPVNSNSGLEAGPLFSMILGFLSARLW